MARKARRKADSGIYHIMLRGIDRQKIFKDDEDMEKFKELLTVYKKRSGFELLGYCFMINHVHLLMREAANPSVIVIQGEDYEIGPGEPLETVFKRIGVSYAYYFNHKYKRIGHLFQDRFRSEVIENDRYLITALRYIHRNPVKAGMCKDPLDYAHSSYLEYMSDLPSSLVDTEYILNIFSKQDLAEYTAKDTKDSFIDIDYDKRQFTDIEAKELLHHLLEQYDVTDFHQMEKCERQNIYRILYEEGVTISQISRITGYSRPLIYNAFDR